MFKLFIFFIVAVFDKHVVVEVFDKHVIVEVDLIFCVALFCIAICPQLHCHSSGSLQR